MINVREIIDLHAATVQQWHQHHIDNQYNDFLNVVCRQHQQNFKLWHQEDIARSPDVSDADLARVKRSIDKLNQQRNDLIEQLDDAIIIQVNIQETTAQPIAKQNTETPGSAIDRLSILSLRIYHMEEQAFRTDASDEHIAKAKSRLEILYEQHRDLCRSLQDLLDDIFAGRKCMKIYRQFKMYNDPTMNPYLYNAAKRPAA
jgi:hypothetical protein